jgi:hypothetical protein
MMCIVEFMLCRIHDIIVILMEGGLVLQKFVLDGVLSSLCEFIKTSDK